jgi:hypothetical protein
MVQETLETIDFFATGQVCGSGDPDLLGSHGRTWIVQQSYHHGGLKPSGECGVRHKGGTYFFPSRTIDQLNAKGRIFGLDDEMAVGMIHGTGIVDYIDSEGLLVGMLKDTFGETGGKALLSHNLDPLQFGGVNIHIFSRDCPSFVVQAPEKLQI